MRQLRTPKPASPQREFAKNSRVNVALTDKTSWNLKYMEPDKFFEKLKASRFIRIGQYGILVIANMADVRFFKDEATFEKREYPEFEFA